MWPDLLRFLCKDRHSKKSQKQNRIHREVGENQGGKKCGTTEKVGAFLSEKIIREKEKAKDIRTKESGRG